MASYVVAAAVFVIGSSVLIGFVVEPPGNPGQALEEQDLKTKAQSALDVLMGTPGYPSRWEQTGGDTVTRLGLVEHGSSVRLDPLKFSALARGRFTAPSSTNGFVDYHEAKEALGLAGYDFHIRVSPLLRPDAEGFYGTAGMGAYRVAYIGDYTALVPSAAAAHEQAALDALDVGFRNFSRATLADVGDVYRDDSAMLKSTLVPLLGTSVGQTAITQGSGNAYNFHRVNATDIDHVVLPTLLPDSKKSLALSIANSKGEHELGYTKGREIRAILATANLSGQTSATLAWKEYVETGGDAGDYGFIEVSPDAGASWYAITNDVAGRSQDTVTSPQPAQVWRDRSATISLANCAACVGNEEVLLAIHWVADGDNDRGTGWILDQMTVSGAYGALITKDFETPEYDLLVVGSNVDQNALTAAEVKYALRDYVQTYGGRILVLGGDTNTQWLQPLFHVGITTASQGVSNPDPTHPLVTTPNELAWQGYDYNKKAWTFGGGVDSRLFDMVVGTGTQQHILSVSTSGAFGASEGGVILTTYLPWKMPLEQRLGFLANAITYGHFHYLYMEVGPEVPSNVPVGAVSRTAIMQKTVDDATEFTELGFILYLWRGDTKATGAALPQPSAPRYFEATAGAAQATLKWAPPEYFGSATFMGYNVYRSTGPGTAVRIANVSTLTLDYVDAPTGTNALKNGVTYYYNVSGWNWKGEGASTQTIAVTPATVPAKPGSLSATGAASQVLLTWTDPADSGGAAITGYKVYRSASKTVDAGATPIAELGATNSYADTNPPGATTSYYWVVAVNGMGSGPPSTVVGAAPLSVPSAPPNVAATPNVNSITVTWSPPTSLTTVTAYHVYAGSSAGSTAKIGETNGTTLTYTESGLTSGTTRYYRVLAVNAAGAGSLSTAAQGTTLTLSTAPTLFTATGDADSIVLTWAPPTDPGSATPITYRIWRGLTSTSLTVLANTTSGTNTTFIDMGLPDAATRFYQVAAVTSAGEGARTAVTSATTHDVASAPVLTLTPGVERMTLTWTVPATTGAVGEPIVSYKIYRGEAPGTGAMVANVTLSPTEGTTNVLYQDTGLVGAKTYWYYVRAYTRAGDGSPSNEASAATLAAVKVVL